MLMDHVRVPSRGEPVDVPTPAGGLPRGAHARARRPLRRPIRRGRHHPHLHRRLAPPPPARRRVLVLEVRRADQRTIVGGRTYDLTREPPELLAFLDLRGARTELAHASAPPRQETTSRSPTRSPSSPTGAAATTPRVAARTASRTSSAGPDLRVWQRRLRRSRRARGARRGPPQRSRPASPEPRPRRATSAAARTAQMLRSTLAAAPPRAEDPARCSLRADLASSPRSSSRPPPHRSASPARARPRPRPTPAP